MALDLFCGAGGATKGLQQAGFRVTGVDIREQPHYVGDEFHQADAMTFPLEGFDFVWASPPCQAYTQASARWRGKGTKADEHPELIPAIRERLRASGAEWVIENVVGARRALRHTVTLHGGMFGLGVHRPRLFEASFVLLAPKVGMLRGSIGVYGKSPDGRRLNNATTQVAARSLLEAQVAMGMPWGDWHGVKEAIPPAYSEFIGRQALAFLMNGA